MTQISSGAPDCLSGVVRTMLRVNLGLPGFMPEMTLRDEQAWASSRSAQQALGAASVPETLCSSLSLNFFSYFVWSLKPK